MNELDRNEESALDEIAAHQVREVFTKFARDSVPWSELSSDQRDAWRTVTMDILSMFRGGATRLRLSGEITLSE